MVEKQEYVLCWVDGNARHYFYRPNPKAKDQNQRQHPEMEEMEVFQARRLYRRTTCGNEPHVALWVCLHSSVSAGKGPDDHFSLLLLLLSKIS